MQVTSGLYKNIAEWSGCMRQILKERTTDVKHQVDFRLIIDMDPNNLSTIYRTFSLQMNVISMKLSQWLHSTSLYGLNR